MSSGELVPFGKYKGQPVEVLMADADYRDWLMPQPWSWEQVTGRASRSTCSTAPASGPCLQKRTSTARR
jgi:hypothetical protein